LSLPERATAFATEILAGLVRRAALWAHACERRGAFRAKFAPFAIFSSALCAIHRYALSSSSSAIASFKSAVSKAWDEPPSLLLVRERNEK
jgi:hypothetical protein